LSFLRSQGIIVYALEHGNIETKIDKSIMIQSIVISTRGTIGHNVGLLFIVYVIVGKLVI
jgi:hypothetical protein